MAVLIGSQPGITFALPQRNTLNYSAPAPVAIGPTPTDITANAGASPVTTNTAPSGITLMNPDAPASIAIGPTPAGITTGMGGTQNVTVDVPSVPSVNDVRSFLQQNPGMTDGEIFAAMNQYNVTPERMAEATGLTADQVNARISALRSTTEMPIIEPIPDSVSDSGLVSPAAPTSMFDTSLDYMKFAAEGTKGLTGYTPQTVTAGTMPGVDISQYMNPYTQEVIDRSLADIERQRLMQQQQTAAQAQAAGAFGGSRQGVAQALTNEAFARQAAQTSANLRQQGFGQATGLAQSDLNRQLQAQQLNQAAGLQGAGFQLGAQSQLGGMGLTGYNLAQTELDRFMANEAAKQGMQTGLYGQQIGQAQSFFGQPAQALGYVPSAISGLPYSQSTTAGMQPGVFDYLTLSAYAAPTLMKLSDQQLKTDIKEIKTLDNGIKVVSWNWNQAGKKIADPNQPTIGVIAQQIAKIIPEAVKRHASGYLMVDYSHPELRGI